MHIIATGKDNRLLVWLTREELSQLQGLHSVYADGFKEEVGTTVPMSEIYNSATEILTAHKEAGEAAKKLRAAGDKFAQYFERIEARKANK